MEEKCEYDDDAIKPSIMILRLIIYERLKSICLIIVQLSPPENLSWKRPMTKIESKVKVLFFFLSGDVYGGSKSLLSILSSLPYVSSSIQPIAVVPTMGRLTEELDQRGIPWIIHDLSEPRSFWEVPLLLISAYRWLRKLKPSLLYINANAYWRPLEILAAKFMSIPVITHHRLVPDKLSPFHRYNSLVIANSNYVAGHITPYKNNIEVLDNPVDLEAFNHAVPNPDLYGILPGELSIFYIGQIKAIKGVGVFLDAAEYIIKLNPNIKFILIGDTKDQAYADYIRSRIESIRQVRWMGYEPKIECAYATADIIVMPSIWDEPFGRITIEAGAAAKPIVCSKVGGIPEIIRNGENGLLVPSNDAEKLSYALLDLIKNPELRFRLGKFGRLEVERRFAAPVVTRKLIKVLMPFLSTTSI